MTIEQKKWTKDHGWSSDPTRDALADAQLVLVFGATAALKEAGLINAIRRSYPGAHVLGCSTAGEIAGTNVAVSRGVMGCAMEGEIPIARAAKERPPVMMIAVERFFISCLRTKLCPLNSSTSVLELFAESLRLCVGHVRVRVPPALLEGAVVGRVVVARPASGSGIHAV